MEKHYRGLSEPRLPRNLALVQACHDLLTDELHRRHRIDRYKLVLLLVELEDGCCLLPVNAEAIPQRLDCVILALHERLTSNVVPARDLGRFEEHVIAAARSRMNEPPSDSFKQLSFISAQLYHCINPPADFMHHLVEFHCLSDRLRKAVEKEAATAGITGHIFPQQTNH